ncbi:cell division protein FtsL, partial [Clostridium perfringens]|nr:cell division protein FtsL [Clostridium perfringens]
LQVSCIALVLGISSMARDGKVYKMQNDLSKVKNEMKVATEEGKALKVNLLKYEPLSDIVDAANKEGMKIPGKNDSVVVDLTKNFFANLSE